MRCVGSTTLDRGSSEAMARRASNVRCMHLLDRLAAGLGRRGVPPIVLGAAALNLTVYDEPDERPAERLDLLVEGHEVAASIDLFEDLGGRCTARDATMFPRYASCIDYVFGDVFPVPVALHARPFRPRRCSRFVPDDAFRGRAQPVSTGSAPALIPAPEHMVLDLAVRAALDEAARAAWQRDLRQWSTCCGVVVDWADVVETARRWRLVRLVRTGLGGPQRGFEVGRRGNCPPDVIRRLAESQASWRDRLAAMVGHLKPVLRPTHGCT